MAAPTVAHYRAFWVDTFNTPLNTHSDVAAVVAKATTAHANAVFAQVRRRGDAWYRDTLEPLPDGVPILLEAPSHPQPCRPDLHGPSNRHRPRRQHRHRQRHRHRHPPAAMTAADPRLG